MMKLYYSKGACSLAPHIILEELGLPYQAEAVNLWEDVSEQYLRLNPMGAVPALVMENGQALTEGAVILQYLADQKTEVRLAPQQGTLERYRLQEWLNFLSTEIHRGFSPLWAVEAMSSTESGQAEVRNFFISELGRKFDVLTQKMGKNEYLLPSGYSVADAYLFTVLSWHTVLEMDLSRWPGLLAYIERIKNRPATQRALKAENMV